MMIKGVIFDIDQTLVGTECLADLRNQRLWSLAVSQLGKAFFDSRFLQLFAFLESSDIRVGLVTSSVSYYAKAIVSRFSIPHDALVCFHDTRHHKPDPEPVHRCCEMLKISPENILGVGDQEVDFLAYSRAHIQAVRYIGYSDTVQDGCAWSFTAFSPGDLETIIAELNAQ